ncbi:MAG: hypothetical protein ACE5EM_00030 [Sphingomonadales bacterium]
MEYAIRRKRWRASRPATGAQGIAFVAAMLALMPITGGAWADDSDIDAVSPPEFLLPSTRVPRFVTEPQAYPRSISYSFDFSMEERMWRDRLRPTSRVTRHNLINSAFANYLTGLLARPNDSQ